MKKCFVVAHTHWDREWHKTFQENRVRLISFMDDLFETLSENPQFDYFVLDGQTSLLLDYLEIKPYQQDTLKTLIANGRVIVGPWYVQPDENIPSGESLIRNLLVSKTISDRFGGYMKIGYMPDSFGQSGCMPTILKAFGIDSAVFYRGLSQDDSPFNEFVWQGYDGSKVIAVWLPIGYGNAMFLSSDADKNIVEVNKNIDMLQARSVSENYLFMSGSDQCFTKKALQKACVALNKQFKDDGKDYSFQLSNIQDYIDAITPHKASMTTIKGEMRKGRHSRTHISIAATRLDIKRENVLVDAKYKFLLEPLSALLSVLDNHHDYPTDLINRGWRYIIENHAHDSICCCCTDKVHHEMLMRFEYANQIADTLIQTQFERLHTLIQYDNAKGRPIVLFSSCLGERTGFVTVDVFVKSENFTLQDPDGNNVNFCVNNKERFNLKDTKVGLVPLPDDWYDKTNISFFAKTTGLGYTTYYVVENTTAQQASHSVHVHHDGLENDAVKLTIEPDGSLVIIDKHRGVTYKNQHIIIDSGNAGDSYDFSPPENNMVVSSVDLGKSHQHTIEVMERTPEKATISLRYNLFVPKTTNNDGRSVECTNLSIETEITLFGHDACVDFKTTINNTADNHRVQVVFDLGKPVASHTSDVQLGEIKRDNVHAQTAESEKSWHERYYPIYTQQRYTALCDDDGQGFMVMNIGLPQYEILQGDTTKLAITLLSSVGFMGNANLLYRPGRRSGAVCATPDSQMHGQNTTCYRLHFVDKQTDKNAVAEAYANPIVAISYPEYATEGIINDQLTLLNTNSPVALGAFKKTEDGSGYALRIVNQSVQKLEHIWLTAKKHVFKDCTCIDAAENAIEHSGVAVLYENNADQSNKESFGGKIIVNSMSNNSLLTLKITR